MTALILVAKHVNYNSRVKKTYLGNNFKCIHQNDHKNIVKPLDIDQFIFQLNLTSIILPKIP